MMITNRADRRKALKNGELLTYRQAYEMVDRREREMVRKSVHCCTVAAAWALRKNFGFGHGRMKDFLAEYATIFEDIHAGRLTIDDICKQIKEEIDIDIVKEGRGKNE